MDVLVVGGGISGLVAARDLAQAGVAVTLVEAGPRLGGKIATERIDGFVVEAGPDSFLATRPAAVELCRELGLRDRLIGTTEPRAVFVQHRGRLLPLPEGLALVLPTRLRPFLTSPLFSPREKLRMGLDLLLPRGRLDGDESVGAVLRRRAGGALVERLAGPLVGGIYGTDVDELSLLAVMPQLREAERSHRSLLLAGLAAGRTLREAAKGHVNGTVASGPTGGSGRHGGALEGSTAATNQGPSRSTSMFLSLAGGMSELVDALRTALERAPQPVDVRTGTTVEVLEAAAGAYRAHLSDGAALRAEAVVLAVPAWAAARILGIALPAAVRALRSIPFGSSLAVSLGFREDQLTEPLRGHGYLVPPAEDHSISACTWSSEKWTARAPAGFVLIRAFVRSPDSGLLAATDETLVGAVRADLERTMGVRGAPVLTHVARWPDAMPRYTVGHLDRVQAVEAAMAALPGIVVAGASYRGVGLPDCVAQGRAAAARVLGRLGGGPRAGISRTGTESDGEVAPPG